MHVLQRIDALRRLLDLSPNHFRNQFAHQLRQRHTRGFSLNNLRHSLPDRTDLRRGSVGGLLDLIGAAFGEGDGEESEEVVVGGLDGDVGFDQGLPFAYQGAKFVRGEVEAVEVGQTVLALDFVAAQLDFAEGVVFVVLEVGEGDFEDAAFEGVVGVLHALGSVDEGLADTVRFHGSIILSL